MKTEIKSTERGTKDYYDELLYIAKKHNKLLSNPNIKIYRMTKFILFVSIVSLCLLIVGIISFILDQTFINMFIVVIALAYIFIASASYSNHKKLINDYINSGGTSVFEMDKKGIKNTRIINDSESKHEVKWDSVKHILISKYSITFINDDKMVPLLSLDIRHKDKVLKGLVDLQKENVIVHNKYYSGE